VVALIEEGLSPEPDFRTLFESAPGLYLALSPALTIVAVSDAYLHATMTAREAILGRPLFDVFPDNPSDPDASGVGNLRASLERVLLHARPDAMAVQKYDIRRPEAEGGGFEVRYWSPVNSPVLSKSGEVRYIIHRVEDVTAFVRLKELENEQNRLNTELRTRAGSMEAEIYRRAQEIQEANRQLRMFQNELESRVEARTRQLHQANEALQKSEEQLRQSQKLEAVGRLAGGIAHDFNNLLSVILSYSDLLLNEFGSTSPHFEAVDEIRKAGERAADLTHQLLAFSRQQLLDPQILDLNATLTGVGKMLTRVLGEDVDLRIALAPDLAMVKADKSQIEQVIMNLVVNARDAMPKGGKLTIETANVLFDEACGGEHEGTAPGHYVMLAVSDTGIGMDETTQARIFEPFFTTKEPGRGTGLGLSTVFGIVKQSRGSIGVHSEPGSGATFKVYLPRALGAPHVDEAPPGTREAHGTETILLVEDEAQVRTVATGILRKIGYTVLVASNGADALRICRECKTEVHLLLTDVVMPKMNGRELAESVAQLFPNVKLLFMSGYASDSILQHGDLGLRAGFLQKPLTPSALTAKVREVLDTPPNSPAPA
jgi:signal transduction histidine kinase